MPKEISYKGYQLAAESHQSKSSGKWIPQARLTPSRENVVLTKAPLTWPREFASQKEADDFVLESAQIFIDEKY